MITINLLSSKEKKDITFEKTNISIISSFVVLLIVSVLLSIVLYTIHDLQKENLKALSQQAASVRQFLDKEENKAMEEKVRKINYYLITINKNEKERTRFSKSLAEIASLTPDKIRLFNIALSKEEKKFEISGNAKSRDSLLQFSEYLEKSEYFENIESPLSNLISPTNINFSLTGGLTEKALTNR